MVHLLQAALIAVLVVGCATSPITIHHPKMGPITIEPSGWGRVCYDIQISPKGKVAVTVAQDGTSDWIGVRILPSILSESIAAVMAVVGAPMEILLAVLGVPKTPLPEPSPLSACSAIFE